MLSNKYHSTKDSDHKFDRWSEPIRSYFDFAMLSVSATAQQTPGASDTQILQQLVAEVRQLRLALERTNSVSSRLQITLHHIQVQQNQANRIDDLPQRCSGKGPCSKGMPKRPRFFEERRTIVTEGVQAETRKTAPLPRTGTKSRRKLYQWS
jgi:hypothetical protein